MPEQESEHAYIRRADGVTYVCPWQTRLRCLLAYGRMLSAPALLLPGTVPAGDDDQAMAAAGPARGDGAAGPAARLHILASAWTMPLAWFVPFAAAERWLALGPDGGPDLRAAATASATRALVYTTPMSRARRRVARGLAALRGLPSGYDDADLGSAPARRPNWPRSAGGWRTSTRTRWWNSTTAGWCTCSATKRSAAISRSPRSARPSTGRPRASASSRWRCTSGAQAGGERSPNSSMAN